MDEEDGAARQMGAWGFAEEHGLQEQTTGRRFWLFGGSGPLICTRGEFGREDQNFRETAAKRVFVRVRFACGCDVVGDFSNVLYRIFLCRCEDKHKSYFACTIHSKLSRIQRNRERMKE